MPLTSSGFPTVPRPSPFASFLRILRLVAAVAIALIAAPEFFHSLGSFNAKLILSLGIALIFCLWFQRERLPDRVVALLLSLIVFWMVALIWNSEQIQRARNVLQLMTFIDRSPWTGGHSLGALMGTAVFLALWKPRDRSEDYPQDSEKVLSGPRLITAKEAQERASSRLRPGEATLFWGGLHLPDHCGTEHFAIIGTPGSGKTLSFHLLMKSVLPRLTPGSNRRAIIYDAKRDTCSIVAGIFQSLGQRPPPVWILNPFDKRCSPWRMNQDIREGATAYEIACILIPKTGSESQPFFIDASRALLGGVIEAFVHIAPEVWTLRDVVLTMRHPSRVAAILAACPDTAYLIDKYLTGVARDSDIDATLETFFRRLSFVAAAWHHSAQAPVGLDQWMKSEAILILGADPSFDQILQALNRALFKRIVELTRHLPDMRPGESRQTWFFIDELRNAGNLEDIDKLLVEGRSKGACVVLGFQDLAGLREVFGDKRADEIVGACANKVFLQNGDQTTIDYATKHFKSQEVLETRVSQSQNESISGMSGNSKGYSVSNHRVMRPVIHEGLLKSLPKPAPGRDGLSGYCDTAAVGTEFPYRMDLPPAFLDAELPRTDESTPNVIRIPKEHLRLPDWDRTDLARLGLENLPELASPEPRRPKVPEPDVDHSIFGL